MTVINLSNIMNLAELIHYVGVVAKMKIDYCFQDIGILIQTIR